MHADGPGVDAIHKPAACSWARNVELSELSVEQASIAESESLVPSPDLEPTVWRNDRLGRFPCQLRRRVYDDAAVKMQPVVLCVRGSMNLGLALALDDSQRLTTL